MSLEVSFCQLEEQQGEATGWLDVLVKVSLRGREVVGKAAAPDDVKVKVWLRGREVVGEAAAPDDVKVKVWLRGREVVGEATAGVEVIVGGGAAFAEEVKLNVSFRIGREGVKEPEEEEMLLSVASYSHKKLVSCSLVSLAMV